MIEFLKNKGVKLYNEIIEIAEQPNLLFSNDNGQCNAEANYNLYTNCGLWTGTTCHSNVKDFFVLEINKDRRLWTFREN
ncbi:hypothetical protein [Paenibacillus periandrae]|uniref:hypothetical protein n=1 Tax=Paenibacillus periandrae TaxID=1761741 RepID=UPI001F0996F1|nr:hypothetical protein [Paenibacillus periandrae]